MSFWAYFWGWLTQSFGRSLDIAHNVRRVLDFLAAWLVVRGVRAAHEGEPVTLTATYLIAATLILLGTLVWYSYSHYREEYNLRMRAEERLRPLLELRGVEPVRAGEDHRRVIVHNLSAGRVRFRARLVESDPPRLSGIRYRSPWHRRTRRSMALRQRLREGWTNPLTFSLTTAPRISSGCW